MLLPPESDGEEERQLLKGKEVFCHQKRDREKQHLPLHPWFCCPDCTENHCSTHSPEEASLLRAWTVTSTRRILRHTSWALISLLNFRPGIYHYLQDFFPKDSHYHLNLISTSKLIIFPLNQLLWILTFQAMVPSIQPPKYNSEDVLNVSVLSSLLLQHLL